MAKIGEIKYEIQWKWWTTPVFLFSELPGIRNWKWFQAASHKFLVKYGFTMKGWGK